MANPSGCICDSDAARILGLWAARRHPQSWAQSREDLIARILQNTPGFFEGVVIDARGDGLWRIASGRVHPARPIRDGGVDGVINEDRPGLDRLYIQADC